MRNKKLMTMHKFYGEPNDEMGKHIVCEKCSFCKTCGDCDKFGCGENRIKKWIKTLLKKTGIK